MAAGETFKGSPDKPESKDSGSGDKKGNKRTTPVRAPLGLSAETPAPQPEAQKPTRLFDIIAEQQLHEQLERQKADREILGSDKKKSKKNKKKSTAEQVEPTELTEPTEPTQSESEQPVEASELSESSDANSESHVEDDEDKPAAEGAVEIALHDDTEEEIALSDRVKEWNRSRVQSPPTAPMSEVGQPTTVSEEAPTPEAEVIEAPADVTTQIETRPVAATEAEPAIVAEAAPEIDTEDEAPVVAPPAFDWQPQPQPRRHAETQPVSSAPEEVPASVEVVETELEQPSPAAAEANDALTPPHNPLFTQQGIDPALMHRQTQEAQVPASPEVVERTVHHRPSDFWPGVFVGGAVEHIRHKRRERKMEKSQKLQQSRIAQLEYTQRRTALEQQTSANERMRTEAAVQHEKPTAPTEVYPMPFVAARNPEQLKAEQQPKQPSPEQPVAAEEVKPLEGHHIEKSTWHKIEVDDRTGHVAENSNIVYGEAFQRERRPEQLAALQAQQQAEADEQERAALDAAGVPTLPRPHVGNDSPTLAEQTVRPSQSTAPVQRSRVLRPAFVQSGADAALWGGLVLVVLAIIAALTL